MPLVFEVCRFFQTTVISRIESIGGGWVAIGGLKQTFKHKINGSAVPSVGDPADNNHACSNARAIDCTVA